jgi:hypothetical protein
MSSSASNPVCQLGFTLLHAAHHATQIVARFTSVIATARAKTETAKTTVEAWSHVIETVAELSLPLSEIKQQVAIAGNEAVTKLQSYLVDVKNRLQSSCHQTTANPTKSIYVGSAFSYTKAENWLKPTERAFTAMSALEKVETYAKNITWKVKSIVAYCNRSLEEKTWHEVESLTEYVQGTELNLNLFMQAFIQVFYDAPPITSSLEWRPVHQLNCIPLHATQNATNMATKLTSQMATARAKTEAAKATVDRILLEDCSIVALPMDYFIPVITVATSNVEEAAAAWCHVTETVAELHTLLSEIKQQLMHESNKIMTKLHAYLSIVEDQLKSRCYQSTAPVTDNLRIDEDFSYREADDWLRATEQTFTAINALEKVETYGKDIMQAVQGILAYCDLAMEGLTKQTSLEPSLITDIDTSRNRTLQNTRILIVLAAVGAGIHTEIDGMSTAEWSLPLSEIKQQIATAGKVAMTKLQTYLLDAKNRLESRCRQITSNPIEDVSVDRFLAGNGLKSTRQPFIAMNALKQMETNANNMTWTKAGNWLKTTRRAFIAMNALEQMETNANNMTWTVKSMVEYCNCSLEEKTLHEVESLTQYVQEIDFNLNLFMQIFYDAPPMTSSPEWRPVHQLNCISLHIVQNIAQNATEIATRFTPQIATARVKTEAAKAAVDSILPKNFLDDVSLRNYFVSITSVVSVRSKVEEAAEAWRQVTETVTKLNRLLSEIEQQLIHASDEVMTKLHAYLSTVKDRLESRYHQTTSHATTTLYLDEGFSYREAENWLMTTEQTFTAMNALAKVETYAKDIMQAVQGISGYCNLAMEGLDKQISPEQTLIKDADTSRNNDFQNIRLRMALAATGAGIDTDFHGMSTMEVRVETETLTDYVQGIEFNMKLFTQILCDVESTDTHIK